MKQEELRIGNLITYYEDKPPFPCGINDMLNAELVLPVKLSEELLLRFGFEKLTTKAPNGYKASCYSYKNGQFIVKFDDGLLSVDIWHGNEKRFAHELQNIYYSLSGEELVLAVEVGVKNEFELQVTNDD